MKKTILIGMASFAMVLFSCGETTSPEELETTATEITSAQEETDALEMEMEEIESAEGELDAALEEL